VQDTASEDDDEDSGDNIGANASRNSLQGDGDEDDVEQDGDGDGDPMSEDDDGDDEHGGNAGNPCMTGGSARPTPTQKHGAGKGTMIKPTSPQKGGGGHVLSNTSKFADDFRQAWCAMNNNGCYDKEVLVIKGPEDEISFAVHELYWSVQSFGGSSQLKNWKLAANDMVTRKTGRPCVPVPGRGYGYMPKAWEKFHLNDYEQKYGASNVPPDYKKPAFVATRKAMLLASGLPLTGRRKEGGDLALSKSGKKEPPARPPARTPAAPRSRTGEASKSRSHKAGGGRGPTCRKCRRVTCVCGNMLAVGTGAGGVVTPAGPPPVASPENIFLLKLLESKTMVRGMTKEEMAIKRAVDQKHKRKLTHLRANT